LEATLISISGAPFRLAPDMWRDVMLSWALIFLVVALVAGVLGFAGIAGAAAGIAKLLFLVFLVLFVISLVMHGVRGRGPVVGP
jgi:uncharacterized membrane protein YtjA (UPF0391 family)